MDNTKDTIKLTPAPALTAELKAKLLEALRIGEDQIRFEYLLADSICKDRYRIKGEKIQAAITKLTNLG